MLTVPERKIMLLLWGLKKASVQTLIRHQAEPKHSYSHVYTTIYLLMEKGLVGRSGKKRMLYYPKISRRSHTLNYFNTLIANKFTRINSEILSSCITTGKKLSFREENVLQYLGE